MGRIVLWLLPDPVSDLYELLPESETSFSVTFQRRDADSLAVCERFHQKLYKNQSICELSEPESLDMRTITTFLGAATMVYIYRIWSGLLF